MATTSGQRTAAAVLPMTPREPANATPDDKAGELFQGLAPGIPPMPNGLRPKAREHWKFIGERLAAAGLLSEVDLGQLRILCDSYALYLDADAEVREQGEYQKTPNNYVQLSPAAVARERHANRYNKIAGQFFLTPRARKATEIGNPNQVPLEL